jgi:hypothetical protein
MAERRVLIVAGTLAVIAGGIAGPVVTELAAQASVSEINWELFWVALTAIGTLGLAGATFLLARQTSAEVTQTLEVERSRRFETAALNADPLSAELESGQIDFAEYRVPRLRVNIRNSGRRVATRIAVTVRAPNVDGGDSQDRDSLLPSAVWTTFRLNISTFVAFDGRGAASASMSPIYVDIESFGVIGQRVFQTFRCDLEAILADIPDRRRFYQSRLQIIPGPAGVHSTDLRLGPPED